MICAIDARKIVTVGCVRMVICVWDALIMMSGCIIANPTETVERRENMKHRIYDKGFFNCPICGKPPYVTIHPPNVAWAECKGSFLRRHGRLVAITVCGSPSHLIKELGLNWNQLCADDTTEAMMAKGVQDESKAD